MPLWSNEDTANSAPKFVTNAGTGATGTAEYANTVSGFGIVESKNARLEGKGSVAPGWVKSVTAGNRTRYETLAVVRVKNPLIIPGNLAFNTPVGSQYIPILNL